MERVGTYRQDSLLLVRHGKMVLDAYYAPYEAGISHDLRSVTKSVVSTLIAIALEEGYFDSVEHPVLDLFADKQLADVDDRKRAVTLQHLLNMTSGIDWQEKAYTPDETIMRMYRAPDRTEFVLQQPMSSVPGTQFYYNSGNPYVLSALITKRTGRSAFDFAKTELFGPLGITSARWGRVDAQGVTDGEAGLYLSPHDIARIGYLYLHDGVWEGKQLIPSSWVARVRAGEVAASYGLHYANLWWSLPEKGAYMALGRHSQVILVLPKADIVAAMTGILLDYEHYPIGQLIDDISAAIKSDAPLPPDPMAQSLLAASVSHAATERASAVGTVPELARDVSGKVYEFADNELHVKTFSLDLAGSNPSWEIVTATGGKSERFAGSIGLDGLSRKSAASYGTNAVKGHWAGDHTFVVERRVLGHSETQRWALSFGGNAVDVSFETTDGYATALHGEARN